MVSMALSKLMSRENLSMEEAEHLLKRMITASEVEIAAVLSALQTKRITSEELTGFARALRDMAGNMDVHMNVADTCGTGGDGYNTINVSTASAFVLSCFIPVAKHGNTGITSKCGSADLLREMGIQPALTASMLKLTLQEIGFSFLYAPVVHKTVSRVSGVRRALKVPTVFNLLGPLSNPVKPDYQLIGVFSPDLCELIAESMAMLGTRGLVVHGSGLDEVSVAGTTEVWEVRKTIDKYTIHPEDFGLKRRKLRDLTGRDSRYNRKVIMEALSGREGPVRDFILMNSGVALYASERVKSIEDGIEACRQGFDDGTILKHVRRIMKYYKDLRCGNVRIS